MTTHSDLPSPDQTGTWEIDWEAMIDARNGLLYEWTDEAEANAYITEYRRQQAAQGMVEVRREDAAWAIRVIERRTTNDIWDLLLADESYQRLLAAAKDQDR